MSKFFAWATVATLLVSLTVVPAFAGDKVKKKEGEDSAKQIEKQFKKLDTNKDGSLSLDEFKASMEKTSLKKGEKKEKKDKE